ncbi:dual specificity protein phosphatase family protein [Spiroplasma taiwanense]|uniref:Tyrosine specific protein phosphatases domain-containing protein n=1 Tax=Spiroplasma taiwanense CT-1 TaxID=1276220 RepID=S5LTV9_9MOLU|nr:dual specificity protein phosphatase family protein [Spiroplasma taiwanense]AGR41154.1 hypothetical protein STAIW_v1c05250 [Spiroplasma taiwanense CT-1]
MYKKIINNLYLGGMKTIPNDADLVLSCAEEIFNDINDSNEAKKIIKNSVKSIYYNFEDYPNIQDMDISLINDAINQIELNILNKKIYVHCVWGVNRSASIVFMYLVRNKLIGGRNYKEAQNEYWKIYPNHSPNPGWKTFLEFNFPYNFIKK